jgi:hypothetical protein
MRTSARDWTKAELLAAPPTMGLSFRKLKQAFGVAKEKKQIQHTNLMVLYYYHRRRYVSVYRAADDRAK